MTTYITELAQREKFEAWWERTQHSGNAPRFGWSHWRDGEGYKVDDDDSELDGMWEAWKAASAELVEALEKAQQERDEFRNRLKLERSILEDADKRIAELESRTVKLPQRLQPGADGYDDWYVHSDDDGEYLKVDDVLAMLTAAGIKVEAE